MPQFGSQRTRHDELSESLRAALCAAKGRHCELAAAVGLHPSELSRWVNLRRFPTRGDSRVDLLAALLGVERAWSDR
jgi:hypothetical protein